MTETVAPPATALEIKTEVDDTLPHAAIADFSAKADEAVALLKALGHEGRLGILCHLSTGEKSVTELELLLGSRQAAVSQQLARLRLEGLVQARRKGQQNYYSIQDTNAAEVVAVLNRLFCQRDKPI